MKIIGEGACRVHGGGFEGTIQAFLPISSIDEFKKYILNISNNFKIIDLSIRETGTTEVIFS